MRWLDQRFLQEYQSIHQSINQAQPSSPSVAEKNARQNKSPTHPQPGSLQRLKLSSHALCKRHQARQTNPPNQTRHQPTILPSRSFSLFPSVQCSTQNKAPKQRRGKKQNAQKQKAKAPPIFSPMSFVIRRDGCLRSVCLFVAFVRVSVSLFPPPFPYPSHPVGILLVPISRLRLISPFAVENVRHIR